jgi:hypothetical protein
MNTMSEVKTGFTSTRRWCSISRRTFNNDSGIAGFMAMETMQVMQALQAVHPSKQRWLLFIFAESLRNKDLAQQFYLFY